MTETLHQAPADQLDRLLGTVGAVMTRKVVKLEADQPADRAVRELARREVSGGPVLDHGRLAGMVTLRGLLRSVAPPWAITGPFMRHEHELAGLRVRDVMTPMTLAAAPDWPVARAAQVMVRADVTSLPVIDGDGVAGIVARDDVIRALAEARGTERDESWPARPRLTPD
jgi:CBS-domain-containing membrane protein